MEDELLKDIIDKVAKVTVNLFKEYNVQFNKETGEYTMDTPDNELDTECDEQPCNEYFDKAKDPKDLLVLYSENDELSNGLVHMINYKEPSINEAIRNILDASNAWDKKSKIYKAIVDYTKVLQTYLYENYAKGIEKWAVECFAPQIQNWIVDEFAPEIEHYFNEEVTPYIENWVKENFVSKDDVIKMIQNKQIDNEK